MVRISFVLFPTSCYILKYAFEGSLLSIQNHWERGLVRKHTKYDRRESLARQHPDRSS